MSTDIGSSFANPAPEKWVKKIKHMIHNVKEVTKTPICIYKVPQRIRVIKPEAYTPLYIGFGPYHHWCDDLYAMEPFKLIASKNTLIKGCNGNEQDATQNLTHLADDIRQDDKIIARVHASYDRHLDTNNKTLAWMMLIDGIFLLQFLQEYIHKDVGPPYKGCLSSCERTAFLVNQDISFYYAILQDIMKLENQIPMFVLDHVFRTCKISSEQHTLKNMLWSACKKLSPFELSHNEIIGSTRDDINTYSHESHLLELLYYLIVPKEPNNSSSQSECRDGVEGGPSLENKNTDHQPKDCCSNIPIPSLEKLADMLKTLLSLKWLCHGKHVKPLTVICKIIDIVLDLFRNSLSICQGQQKSTNDPETGGSSSSSGGNNKEAPKVEEIDIPSVSQLLRVGIEFCPIHQHDMNNPLRRIGFNKKTRKFYLPKITIRPNTEVIIKNLVAYEAVGISGPLILARYTELMNGIIDTAEDVRLLKERGIIDIDSKPSKSDEDVAQLWNGMSRAIRLPIIASMDNAIIDVNKYFNSKIKVKLTRFTKECMFCGWKITMLLLTLVVVVLMSIQSFCEVYRCPRAIGSATEPGS